MSQGGDLLLSDWMLTVEPTEKGGKTVSRRSNASGVSQEQDVLGGEEIREEEHHQPVVAED